MVEEFFPKVIAEIISEYDSDPYRRFESHFSNATSKNLEQFKKYSDYMEQFDLSTGIHQLCMVISIKSRIDIEVYISGEKFRLPNIYALKCELLRKAISYCACTGSGVTYSTLALYFYLWDKLEPVHDPPDLKYLRSYFSQVEIMMIMARFSFTMSKLNKTE